MKFTTPLQTVSSPIGLPAHDPIVQRVAKQHALFIGGRFPEIYTEIFRKGARAALEDLYSEHKFVLAGLEAEPVFILVANQLEREANEWYEQAVNERFHLSFYP